MFRKVLIANRGEIAVRIMATCREMGISTVAVYSDVDRYARHVREADEAYAIGPAPASHSYLRIDTILDVARRSGAEAIHPGYGFLAENADFAAACIRAGVVFIGPSVSAMRLMGSKIVAKHLALRVGAPTVPGYDGESQDEETLLSEAKRIGFPLLIKAAAGGGGKGMRVVRALAEFREELSGARREARAAFGDATVFLERLIQRPRHVEIQILGDQYGHILYLGERECSIQRRHQKILEESPSVALTPALRATMGETAVRIAQAAQYVNAGTLEFLLDDDGRFYFLEMNTRLQVEHPVTELLTGLDLVRQQLLIAAGEPLTLQQDEVHLRGSAIEVRIYAEDAEHSFLPSTGTISNFVPPVGPGIRLDSGVENGDEIQQYYDPLIAKLIVYGEDRPAALQRLQRALEECVLFGVTTNLPLLHAITQHPAFRDGQTSITFLDEYPLTGSQIDLPMAVLYAAALAALTPVAKEASSEQAAHNPWQSLGPWRMLGEQYVTTYRYQGQDYKLALRPSLTEPLTWQIQVNDQPGEDVSYAIGPDTQLILLHNIQQIRFYIWQQPHEIQVFYRGQLYRLQRQQAPDVTATAHEGDSSPTQKSLRAPMAGTLVKVQVQAGESVTAHQPLVILSAMKMEHAITAPYEGKVQRVLYSEGTVVQGGAIVVEME